MNGTAGPLDDELSVKEAPTAEHPGNVSANIILDQRPASRAELLILSHQYGSDRSEGMGPFVKELIQDPGIGMLWDKTGSEEFQARGGDFLDDTGIVEEPPAAKWYNVWEFPGGHAEFVLVFT